MTGSASGEPANPDVLDPEDPPELAPRSVGARTLRGLLWAYGSYVGGRILVLVSTAILARLLTPAEFGLVAIALVLMIFLDAVRDLGLTQALIRSPDEHLAEHTQTVFVGTVAMGALLGGVLAAAAPLAAGFFGHDELTLIIAVLAANFFLRNLGATHEALAKRALDYRVRTIADGLDVVVRGVTGIGLALAGAGVWSLVLGYVAGSAVRVVAAWMLVPWRPSRTFPRAHLRELARFGGLLTVVDVVAAVSSNLDYLFVGRVLGPTSLGLYTIGFRLPELLIMNVAIVAGDVLFPAYAAMDRERLREGFLLSMRYIALLVLPLAAGLVVLAEPTVAVLFGDRFAGSVDVMRVLAIYAVFVAVNIPAGTIYKVTGRGGILLYTAVPQLLVLGPVLALVTEDGILAVGIAVAGCMGLTGAVMLGLAARTLGVGLLTVLRALLIPVVAAGVMALAMLGVTALADGALVSLAAGGIAGAVTYAAVVLVLDRDVLPRIVAIWRSTTAAA